MAELEETLYGADLGPALAGKLIEEAELEYQRTNIRSPDEVADFVRARLKAILPRRECEPIHAPEGTTVVLVVGVNGTGKTTSIAKLAKLYKDAGWKVLIAAADTFRAAAVEQLSIWAERVGVDIVKGTAGADAGAVAHDACEAAKARGANLLLVDTAGRLHTKDHLMRELDKIRRVVARQIPGAPHEILLVLDATTGLNAVSQAKVFTEDVGVTGLVLTKSAGTARGGVGVAVWNEVRVPVKYLGFGETPADLAHFSPGEFIDALFELPPEEWAAPEDEGGAAGPTGDDAAAADAAVAAGGKVAPETAPAEVTEAAGDNEETKIEEAVE